MALWTHRQQTSSSPKNTPNLRPGDVIRQYIQANGINSVSQAKQLCSFLDDFLLEDSVEKRVMKAGIQQGILDSLIAHNGVADKIQVVQKHIQKIENEIGLSNYWARYVVEEMISALSWNVSVQQIQSAAQPIQAAISPQMIDLCVQKLLQPYIQQWSQNPPQPAATSRQVQTPPVPSQNGTFTYSDPYELFEEWEKRRKSVPRLKDIFLELLAHVVGARSNLSLQELTNTWRNAQQKIGFNKKDFIRCIMKDKEMGGCGYLHLPDGSEVWLRNRVGRDEYGLSWEYTNEAVEKFLNKIL